MIVPSTESTTATAVYVNSTYVATLRPDPVDTDRVSIVKLEAGESIRVQGDHRQVADMLARTP
jgi:hypothetical protein